MDENNIHILSISQRFFFFRPAPFNDQFWVLIAMYSQLS